MKIGEYFILKNYITQDMLNEALERQTNDKSLRLGEILVKTGAISEENLNIYIGDFIENIIKKGLDEASAWLSQDEVDELFIKYGNIKMRNILHDS